VADIEVDLVAADGKVWSGTAQRIVAPAGDGEMGILAGHTPVLTVLKPGEIRVLPAGGGEVMRWQVEGGFLSFDSNQATVVVDSVVSGGRTASAASGH